MLAVSGRLNPKAGGPSVMVPVDPDLVQLLYKPSQWAVDRRIRPSTTGAASTCSPSATCGCRSWRCSTPRTLQISCAAPGIEHARAAGAGAAERRLCQPTWPMRSPRRLRARGRRRTPAGRSTWPFGWRRPAADAEGDAARARVPEDAAAAGVRPGDVQPERVPVCELTCREHISHRPALAASSSATPSAASAALALASMLQQEQRCAGMRRIRWRRSRRTCPRPRRSRSSSCSWPAGRATWRRSTPSRC